eukprot:scaffold42574_cov65-Attheya_sp.AAC.3
MCCVQVYERAGIIGEQVPSCTVSTDAHDLTKKEPKALKQAAKWHGTQQSLTAPSQVQSSFRYIPSNHTMKLAWDVLTILLSLTVGVYTTHASMRDQCFPHLLNNTCAALNKGQALPLFFGYFHGSTVVTLYDLWRVADIVLNFLTEDVNNKKNGCSQGKSPTITVIRAKLTYLTTWFLIDVVTLLSWEVVYVQPVFNRNRKKNVFLKAIGVIRIYPFLRITIKRCPVLLRILKRAILFAGRGFLGKLIRYAPKYIAFALTGNMKVIVALRVVRQVRLFRSLMARKSLYGYLSYSVPKMEMTTESVAVAA